MTFEEMLAKNIRERKSRKRMTFEEDSLQMACVKWFDLQYPQYSRLMFHTPNEGKVTKKQASRRRAMGVRAGVADLILLVPRCGWSCLAVELKTKKGTQRDNQKIWQQLLLENGGLYVICRGIEEFIEIVNRYLDETYREFYAGRDGQE